MLKEFKLSNYRLFSDEVTIRFRPITVIIGRNNAGKSSVIKFLLMLQQTLASNIDFLLPQGPRVQLEPFEQMKTYGGEKQPIEFSLTCEGKGSSATGIIPRVFGVFQDKDDRTKWQKADYTRESRAKVRVSSVEPPVGRQWFCIRVLLDGDWITVSDKAVWEEGALIDSASGLLRLQSANENSKVRGDVVDCDIGLKEMRADLENMRHLQANRDELPRLFEAKTPPTAGVGQRGEHTLEHIAALFSPSQDDDRRKLFADYAKNVLDIEEFNFIDLPGNNKFCEAKNRKTGKTVNIASFGFGVSQCLPILMQGMLMRPHSHLIVEQPEEQLHPTAQIELGSYFADLWLKHEVCSIIETHSDGELLRLRRLVAKGDLSSEDVAVVYLHEEEGVPKISNLDINADDGSIEGLPMEFFGRIVIEGLNMGAKK